jgi:hypothetical protein
MDAATSTKLRYSLVDRYIYGKTYFYVILIKQIIHGKRTISSPNRDRKQTLNNRGMTDLRGIENLMRSKPLKGPSHVIIRLEGICLNRSRLEHIYDVEFKKELLVL